jgi:hypothetical protein
VAGGPGRLPIKATLAIESLIPRLLPRSPRHGPNVTCSGDALAFRE